jgi:hypothetical protein
MIPERILRLACPGFLLGGAGLQFIAWLQSLGLCFCGFALLSYFSLSVTILLELAGHSLYSSL